MDEISAGVAERGIMMGRVNPGSRGRWRARLQAANKSDHPIFLMTTSIRRRHGIGTSLRERIDEEADVWDSSLSSWGSASSGKFVCT